MNDKTDTPRTDAEIIYPGSGIAMVHPNFARTLERELAKWREVAGRLFNALRELPHSPGCVELQERVKTVCTCSKREGLDAFESLSKSLSDGGRG